MINKCKNLAKEKMANNRSLAFAEEKRDLRFGGLT